MTDAPKCACCRGFAFEPDAFPLAPCAACGGTGKPPVNQVPTFLANAQQKELANG